MRKAQVNPKAREKLLEAAQHLMLTQGFAATTIDEICVAVRLTKGSFFHYFKSKDHLGELLLERFCCSSMQKMQECGCHTNNKQDPLERVYNYIDFMIKSSKDVSRGKGCLIGTFAQELSDTYPKIRSMCADGFDEWTKIFEHDLKEAKAKYAPRASFDVKSLAQHFIAIAEGSQILAKAKQDKKIIEKNMVHFKEYLKSLFKK